MMMMMMMMMMMHLNSLTLNYLCIDTPRGS